MLHQRCTREPCLPTDLSNRLKRRSATPLVRFFKANKTPVSGNRNCATELRRHLRKSMVDMKPVCTPVPPVNSGSAAGAAGLAPPASASPELATRRLAASGTILLLPSPSQGSFMEPGPSSGSVRNISGYQPDGHLIFLRKPVLHSRPRAADGPVSRRKSNCLDLIAVSFQCGVWRDSAHYGADHQSRVRELGELAHPSRKIGP